MNDPKKYREMCQPFESTGAADEALIGFQKELRALREKYKIRDVTFSVAIDITTGENEAGEFTARVAGHIGSSRNFVELAAYALGEARAGDEEMIKAVELLGKRVARDRK